MKLKQYFTKRLSSKIAVTTSLCSASVLGAVYLISKLILGELQVDLGIFSEEPWLLALLTLSISLLFYAFNILFIKKFVTSPLKSILATLSLSQKGDYSTRLSRKSNDEMGSLVFMLSQILKRLSELQKVKLHTDKKLNLAEEELVYKEELEEKKKEIELSNGQLKESLHKFSLLTRMTQALSSVLDPNELYETLNQLISEELEVKEFCFYLADKRKKRFVLASAYGYDAEERKEIDNPHLKVGEGIITEALRANGPLSIENTSSRPNYIEDYNFIKASRSILLIPVMRKEKILGLLYLTRLPEDTFDRGEKDLLQTLASQVAVTLENSTLYSRAKGLTIIDDLTSIYNRRYFYQTLTMEAKRSKRFKRYLSLLILDVDYFKRYNDTFGHLAGDQLLRELARILKKNVREVDTLARYGGEEFALILPDTSLEEGYLVAEKIRKIVELHFKSPQAQRKSLGSISISIGVSCMPYDAGTIDDLINHADMALYSAKTKGRNQVAVFCQKNKPELKAIG